MDICRQSTDPDMKSFMHPVIAQYVQIIPLSWEGPSPCLTVELYGCSVLGKMMQLLIRTCSKSMQNQLYLKSQI